MRAWMVRAGSQGEREQRALDQGRVLAGWAGVTQSLESVTTRQQFRELLQDIYGDEANNYTIGSWAGQLWRFKSEMSAGDVVVMPLKLVAPGSIAIGKICGEYQFDPDAPEGCQHFREVHWSSEHIDRGALGPDLRASLGALTTICELTRHKAAVRLENILESGDDPEALPSEDGDPEEYLSGITKQIEEGATPSATIREILGRWKFFRRTATSVNVISEALKEFGLLTVPPITEGAIDDAVHFTVISDGETEEKHSSQEEISAESIDAAKTAHGEVSTGEVKYAVDSLPSAHYDVTKVHPDDPLSQALTEMAFRSYSQLAVVDSREVLIGAVTWESVAMSMASGTPEFVRDAMIPAESVAKNEDILSITNRIYENEYVFVRDAASHVQGIITASDLTKKFGDDHAPIVQLDEIERRLGQHISECCSDADLKDSGVRIPSYGKTLGTYVAVLSKPTLWGQLGWSGLDRVKMHALMDDVRKIRNDIMHFSPDPVSEQETDTLARAMRTLRLITNKPE